MKVAVVILNWNTVDYLRRFLPPLLESVAAFNDGGDSAGSATGSFAGSPAESLVGTSAESATGSPAGTGRGLHDDAPDLAEVVVADSGSTDGSMEMLAEEFPSVRRIPLGKNYGFTGGYNRAFKLLEENHSADGASDGIDQNRLTPEGKNQDCSGGGAYDLFVLLNSDIEVTRNWLRPLADWMKNHPDCGACGPKLHSWYERDKFEYAGAAGGLIDRFGYPFCRGRVMGRVETDGGQYDTPADVLWVTGACLAVRAEVWKSLGGLDDRFFAHMEEIDLCWRMQLAGWKVTAVPESTVFHLGGGTLPQTSPQKLYLNYRNNLLLLDNNLAPTIGRKRAKLRIFVRKILDGCSAAVYLLSFRKDCFMAVWKAHRDAAELIAAKGNAAKGNAVKQEKTARVAGMYGGCIIPRALFGLKVDCGTLHSGAYNTEFLIREK